MGHIPQQLIASLAEEVFKILLFQQLAFTYAWTFFGAEEHVLLIFRSSQLKGVESADQRSQLVYCAGAVREKEAFSFLCRLFHLINIGLSILDLICEFLSGFCNGLRDLFNFTFQQQDTSGPCFYVTATQGAPCALKT